MLTKAKKAKNARLRREYHITLEQWEKVWKFQDKGCAICRGSISKKGKPLVISTDHNHTSGELRGLLCWRCNKGIAVFQDDPDWLFRASEYLKKPVFEKVFGHKFYTAPGKVGTKKRRKLLKNFKVNDEKS